MTDTPQRRQFDSPDSAAAVAEPSAPHSLLGMVWLGLAFLAAYTVVGLAGITLQSAQAGVTPVWPASGVALGLAYWFGRGYVVLILPAMLILAWMLGVPFEVASIAAGGSMLEALLAVWALRHFGLSPTLLTLRDALLFVSLAAVLAPVLSATAGTIAMSLPGETSVAPQYIWAMWWLGNSLGVLVVGGLALVLPGRRALPQRGRPGLELTLLSVLAAVATWASISLITYTASALLMYLLIPALVVAALRLGQFGVLTVAAVVLVTLMLANGQLPGGTLGQHELGVFYLDITLVWVATFTGLIVGSARQERQQREVVSWLATHDSLTDLVNRHEFMIRLKRALAAASEQGRHHAVVYIDLDRFKRINDAEGHAAGDHVLRDVAAMLTTEVRRRDTVSRLGGDEFALLLESCPLVEACGIAENIRRALEDYHYRGVHADYAVEASIGVVEVGGDNSDGGTVLHQADVACYEAKRAGRNRVWVGQVADEEARSA